MMSLVMEASYWKRVEKKDFLNKNKTVFPAKTIKLSGLQTEISENSLSFIPMTIIYSQSLFSGTF